MHRDGERGVRGEREYRHAAQPRHLAHKARARGAAARARGGGAGAGSVMQHDRGAAVDAQLGGEKLGAGPHAHRHLVEVRVRVRVGVGVGIGVGVRVRVRVRVRRHLVESRVLAA